MKKIAILLVFVLCSISGTLAQTGKVFDKLTMKSDILKMERNYAIYLPPDYETSEREYPVLYLLHGMGDDQTGWIQFGEVLRITDNAIKKGTATAMIIVMPDANTKNVGYFNSINNTWRYEDFFFEELMPYVENKYRIKQQKRFRAIAGLSMGGGGSFMYALHHPELFSSACPLSAYVGPLSVEMAKETLSKYFNDTDYDEAKLQPYYETHNAVSLVKNLPAKDLKSVKWYIDCGDDDFLFEGNSLVHIEMRKKNIPHEYRVRNGGHTWSYWRTALPKVLEFVSDTFHQN